MRASLVATHSQAEGVGPQRLSVSGQTAYVLAHMQKSVLPLNERCSHVISRRGLSGRFLFPVGNVPTCFSVVLAFERL